MIRLIIDLNKQRFKFLAVSYWLSAPNDEGILWLTANS
jgi:hypothetical protein